ncbi:MAG TPA: hypothetical protein VFV87_16995 [Pirellulaceae bacterium]|nr:hypothetical protein [Pirellulaceae bacterium]
MRTLPRWSIWLLWSLSIVAASIVAAVLAHETGTNHPALFGIGFGALCAIGTIHAIWTVFGPLALITRVPLALLIQSAVVVAVAAVEGGVHYGIEFVGLFGGFLFGQYFLAQLPLWFIALRWRARIASGTMQPGTLAQPDLQFQIRHVMILTAGVAIALGAARGLIQIGDLRTSWPEMQLVRVIAFLVLCNTTIVLPIAVAALIRRRALLASAVAWTLVFLATIVEVPTFLLVRGVGATTHELWFVFWAMNLTQATWVFLSMGILRLGGYRLEIRPP